MSLMIKNFESHYIEYIFSSGNKICKLTGIKAGLHFSNSILTRADHLNLCFGDFAAEKKQVSKLILTC